MFEKIENKWTEDSGDYDDMIQKQLSNKRTVSHWTNELKRLLGPEPLRILEVGCGPGFMSIIAARLGHDVKAIDGSSGMVEKARRNMRYDVILSRDAVWTLYDPEKAFRRWKTVLKPGGRIIYFDGDYRTIESTLKNKIHMKIADFLIYVTERKIYGSDVKENSGIYEKLPFTSQKRPEADFQILKKVRFARIQIRENRWLNRPWTMDFWKYGYQGKKFIVIATKKEK